MFLLHKNSLESSISFIVKTKNNIQVIAELVFQILLTEVVFSQIHRIKHVSGMDQKVEKWWHLVFAAPTGWGGGD